jgi:hypothetical protein
MQQKAKPCAQDIIGICREIKKDKNAENINEYIQR